MKTYLLALALATAVSVHAQDTGTCETGSAQAFLDANNVRAAIYNAGSLFWRGSGNIYTAPKGGRASSLFVANLWIGGLVDGELRFAGTDYGPFEYFPGPLTESGKLPNPSDCSEYDRIYEITLRDLQRLDATGEATADIRDWPSHLGAPVIDGDGNPDNYDLAAGDRPEITGHQKLWWVMNDLGGTHEWGETASLGIELRVSAFAALSTDAALNNTTFYRHEITNPQSYTIDSVYTAYWVDPDVGNASDDFVGSDTTLGMGFAYNGDDFDDTAVGYGQRAPAIGFDIVQGPGAEDDGADNDRDGMVDEDGERLGMSTFMYPIDWGHADLPNRAAAAYNFMRALWVDGSHLTYGGTGYGGDTPTNFHFPGDPVTRTYWSEENTGESPPYVPPRDRRFIIATGPFQLEPGQTEEIVLAIIWARGSDRLDSITELRKADRMVQETWDAGTIGEAAIPPAPAMGPSLTAPADGVSGQPLDVTLVWEQQEYMSDYVVDIATTPDFSGPSHQTFTTIRTSIDPDSLQPFTDYFWRVTGASPVFASPPSDIMHFRTSDVMLASLGLQLIPGTSDPAFVEVSGPGGSDPCGSDAVNTYGCYETGGNFVYASENSTGEYIMYHEGSGPEATIGNFAPNDFELRFTDSGSYAYHPFTGSEIVLSVPFEVWDIGPVGFFNENDPSDDVQLVPILFSDDGGECEFGYGEWDDPFGRGWKMSDRIYGYYAVDDYAGWEETVEPLVEASVNRCYKPADPSSATYWERIDFGRGRPLQRITFNGDPAGGLAPRAGTVVRFYTTSPPVHSPIPAAPASGTGPFTQPLELVWNAPEGNTTTQLQISAGPTFENPVFDATTRDESFIVSGLEEGATYHWRVRLSQPETPWSDTWTFTAGEVTNVSAEPAAELPIELTLDQNYPNPFNPSTTIRFGLPESGLVQIFIYDLLGRRVATLVNRAMTAGWHEVRWNASALASGVYVYTIRTEQRTQTRSMVLMR